VDIKPIEKLDKYVTYLRNVHFFCYYCAEEYDDEDDLQKRCPMHLRASKRVDASGNEVQQDSGSNWAANLDKKIADRLEKKLITNLDTIVEKSLEDFYNENAVEKKAEKYKCGQCTKYFKGPSFVRKHISLKHIEKINEVKQKALEDQFYNNYFYDNNHITPMNIQNNSGHMGWGNWGDNSGPSLGYYGRGAAYSSYPPSNPYHNRYHSGGGRRGRDSGGGASNTRFRPPPGHTLEPEFQKDPRKLKEYVDLDAPTEDAPIIDYRSTLAISNDTS